MVDKELKEQVASALEWEPSVSSRDIGITVDGGVVTLRGSVGSYAEKIDAERTALRTYGVKAVANDLDVRLDSHYHRTDTEIAQAALSALKWHMGVPEDRLTLTVKDGWITLGGNLDRQVSKDAAVRAIRDLTGVKGVTNNIRVLANTRPADIRDKIEAAFKRSAAIDARRINISVHDGKIILSGNVHSWSERQEAEHAAWAAPGVSEVDDRLTIVP